MNQKMREYYSLLSERYHLWNARKALAASGTIWNHLEPFGTAFGQMERPKGSWNARSALEQSRRLYLERPKGSWNSAKRYTAFTGLRSASAK